MRKLLQALNSLIEAGEHIDEALEFFEIDEETHEKICLKLFETWSQCHSAYNFKEFQKLQKKTNTLHNEKRN